MRRTAVFVLLVPLVLTLVAPSAKAGGFCTMEPITDKTMNSVDMKDNCFFPMVVRVGTGESVTWKNYDIEVHTVTAPGGWGSGHKEFNTGDKASFSFDEEGVYPYVCLYHPGMVGAVVVGDGEGTQSSGGVVGTDASGGDAAAGASEAQDASTSPARATGSENVPVLLTVGLTLTAAALVFCVGAWIRKRSATRRSDALA